MQSRLSKGEVVYYDDHRMVVQEGPYRALDAPGIDQYRVRMSNGHERGVWRSDLMTQEEYEALMSGE